LAQIGDKLRDHLLSAAQNGNGVIDTACPECGPGRRSPVNQKRKVLRIWMDDGFIRCGCARCGVTGWVHDGESSRLSRRPIAKKAEPDEKSGVPAFLWSRSQPLAGSLAETYLRSRGCYVPSPSLRFLPARGEHYPAMISRFGTGGEVVAVHLTKLAVDGRGKADTEKQKIMLGHGSVGQPIVVHENEDRSELFISEGIEDAASVAVSTGWNARAAGAAVRIPAVVASGWGGPIYIAVDDDEAGRRALTKARATHADIVPVNFAMVCGAGLDANKVLQRYGADVVLAAIEWCEAQERARRGEIGYEAMCAAMARASAVFAELAK
jgi:hypothetical protein